MAVADEVNEAGFPHQVPDSTTKSKFAGVTWCISKMNVPVLVNI